MSQLIIQPKARSTNRLVTSIHYARILQEYNERLARDGKISNKKFYEEVVHPLIPNYSLQTFYQFLRRYETAAGLVPEIITKYTAVPPPPIAAVEEGKLAASILNNQAATAKGINLALNIGTKRLQELIENPQLMSAKDAVDLVFKAMKAQDSRIHAVGKIREDSRDQAKFDRTFDSAAYG